MPVGASLWRSEKTRVSLCAESHKYTQTRLNDCLLFRRLMLYPVELRGRFAPDRRCRFRDW
jgi:hypothetical protein